MSTEKDEKMKKELAFLRRSSQKSSSPSSADKRSSHPKLAWKHRVMEALDLRSIIKIVAISILLLLVACGMTLCILKERRENTLINPEIYPAMVKIEIYALLYVGQEKVNINEYNRCKAVVDRWEQNLAPGDFVEPVEEYYDFLNQLGFKLPTFKLKNPPSKAHRKECIRESRRLYALQDRVIKTQYYKQVKELERIINEEISFDDFVQPSDWDVKEIERKIEEAIKPPK